MERGATPSPNYKTPSFTHSTKTPQDQHLPKVRPTKHKHTTNTHKRLQHYHIKTTTDTKPAQHHTNPHKTQQIHTNDYSITISKLQLIQNQSNTTPTLTKQWSTDPDTEATGRPTNYRSIFYSLCNSLQLSSTLFDSRQESDPHLPQTRDPNAYL
ncbi:hypothetical protein M758_11G048600 [Ceratodon purpureus]|nr:hypothetical protein M758_11G048600 [Ceratodon purpureus]